MDVCYTCIYNAQKKKVFQALSWELTTFMTQIKLKSDATLFEMPVTEMFVPNWVLAGPGALREQMFPFT